jgi:hypothetical protein
MPDSTVANLNEERAYRANDSKLWSPKDALEAALRDIEDGTIKPTRMVIHLLEPSVDEHGEPEEGSTLLHYVAGASFDEHVALLELAKHITIKRWLR